MAQAGKYLRRIRSGYAHWCPGCLEPHAFAVDVPFSNGARWTFDSNLESPTFAPSMNIGWGRQADPAWKDDEGGRCHYFLKAGQLQFLSDSTHALRGQTVPLPQLPDHMKD